MGNYTVVGTLEERYPGGVVVISSALAPYRPAVEGP